MWETREVTITIRLPHDTADQAEEVQKSDPEFLSRVVLYGLRDRSAEDRGEQLNDLVRGFNRVIASAEWRRIITEQRYHDGEQLLDSEEAAQRRAEQAIGDGPIHGR